MRSAVVIFALVACGKNQSPPPPTTGVPGAQRESGPGNSAWLATAPTDHAGMAPPAPAQKPAAQQAHDMFDSLCVMCHGVDGKGHGAAAVQLGLKAADYTDPTWQASITDEMIGKTIVLGGAGVGKNPQMPGQPQLEKQPEVLAELVKIIRAFKH